MARKNETVLSWLENRPSFLNELSSAEIAAELPERMKAAAFFSAKVGRAKVLERLRDISDRVSSGGMSVSEGRVRLKEWLGGQGYDAQDDKIENLASTTRLNLVLEQNRAMAEAVGRHQVMYDPDVLEMYPYVIYHARGDGATRPEHQALDGRVFRKDDPFLATHTPPWDFNCRCWLEDCDEETAQRLGVMPPARNEMSRTVTRSGYSFNPATAFEANDLGELELKDRRAVIGEMEQLVKQRKINRCSFLMDAPAVKGLPGDSMRIADGQLRQAFDAMRQDAVAAVTADGVDPARPDFQAYRTAGRKPADTMPPAGMLDKIPDGGIDLGTFDTESLGLGGKPLPVRLERGNRWHGAAHEWIHHKEVFTDPAETGRILSETLGSPDTRRVLNLLPDRKQNIVRKLITIHNPETGAYCTLAENDGALQLVAWHREREQYGDMQYRVKKYEVKSSKQ